MISECKSTTEGAPALSACHVTMFFLFLLGFGGEVMKTDTSRKINAWNQQITQLKKENHLPKLQCSAPAFNFEGTNIHPWNSQRCKHLKSSYCALRKGLLAGDFNPFEKYQSNRIISQVVVSENKTCLKPPPRLLIWYISFLGRVV